jgi:uncharacterized delta-60 repeat protein
LRFTKAGAGCRTGAALVFVAVAVAAFVAPADATPGDLDPTFSRNGLVRTGFGAGGYSHANAVAIQPDGRILAAGDADLDDPETDPDLAIARYLPDGRLDSSFSSNGKLRADFGGADTAEAIALQGDGRIVVAGTSNPGLLIARYLPDGTPDPSFSGDGRLITNFSANDLALDSDGRIVVAGTRSGPEAALARFEPDGTPDTSFSGDGVATVGFAEASSGYSVAIEPQGNLVLGGRSVVTQDGDDSYADLALARFKPNGDPDLSFSGDGLATADIIDSDSALDLALRPDGRIVAAGAICIVDFWDGTCAGVTAQFNPDGSLDGSFGDQGIQSLWAPFHAGTVGEALALTGDGGIVVAGETLPDRFYTAPIDFALFSLDPDGSRNLSFTEHGVWTTDFLSGYDRASDVELQSNGRIVVAGSSDSQLALARYEVHSGPRDADADGLRDDADRCPSRFGTSRHGCPHYGRSLTMAFHKHQDLYVGTLASREPRCVDYEEVRVFRVRRGLDFKVDTANTSDAGRWSVDARLHPGRYYAVAPPSTGPKYGHCLKARADGFRI